MSAYKITIVDSGDAVFSGALENQLCIALIHFAARHWIVGLVALGLLLVAPSYHSGCSSTIARTGCCARPPGSRR